MKNNFARLSLTKQFLMISFPILLAGTLVIGWWIGEQVKLSVVHRIGGITALYVDSFVSPYVQTLSSQNELTTSEQESLHLLLKNTPLGEKIISLKIWRKDGYVLYSSDSTEIGKRFPLDDGLKVALRGNIFSEISDRTLEQQAQHGQPMPRLIETYIPIHVDRAGTIIAAAEFYSKPDDIDREAGVAQRRGWLLVAGTMLALYFLLFFVVHRGSKLIFQQKLDLNDKLQQLTVLNKKNMRLKERVIRAAERATAVNEDFLQCLSADIHDGPGQDLGFALMQLKNMSDSVATSNLLNATNWSQHLEPARLAVQSALTDLRAISSDLDLPDINAFNLQEVAARVVRDFQTKTGSTVELVTHDADRTASFRVKATLYRLLQESLANTYRHADSKDCKVVLMGNKEYVSVEICDDGPGFDPLSVIKKERLGLTGMRQRIEVLGGHFEIDSTRGAGTVIRVTLPLTPEGKEIEQHD
jgi:signal transduction histidine kinase